METIQQINTLLSENLPIYAKASEFTLQKFSESRTCLEKVYNDSTSRVMNAKRASKQLKNQAVWLFSRSADDLLDYVEQKLEIQNGETEQKNKGKRLMKIVSQLNEDYIVNCYNKLGNFKGLILKGRQINERYILPLYITFKASVMVSREIMMEVLAERLGQLKMTYSVSKDTVTMLFAGEFQQEKILARLSSNLNSFKQMTISFVQKGMEIQISKKELFENYHTVIQKLTQVVRGVSDKSLEQWNETKTKTVNLYHSVLNRIKEKQIQIRIEYYKATLGRPAREAERENDIACSEEAAASQKDEQQLEQVTANDETVNKLQNGDEHEHQQ